MSKWKKDEEHSTQRREKGSPTRQEPTQGSRAERRRERRKAGRDLRSQVDDIGVCRKRDEKPLKNFNETVFVKTKNNVDLKLLISQSNWGDLSHDLGMLIVELGHWGQTL